jgi:hypothetical protein
MVAEQAMVMFILKILSKVLCMLKQKQNSTLTKLVNTSDVLFIPLSMCVNCLS